MAVIESQGDEEILSISPEAIEEWKSTFLQYKDVLKPNKKTANEILEYVRAKYPLTDITDEMTLDGEHKLSEIVTLQITETEFYDKKVPNGATLQPQVFVVNQIGNGKILYETKYENSSFKFFPIESYETPENHRIIIGLEFESSYCMVEGNNYLSDELFAFQGLDSDDLTNYFLVWRYIHCLKNFNLLDLTLNKYK